MATQIDAAVKQAIVYEPVRTWWEIRIEVGCRVQGAPCGGPGDLPQRHRERGAINDWLSARPCVSGV